MRKYRKSKEYAGPAKHAPEPKPLDDAQLNSVLRHVFAWLWVGMGLTATVASVLRARPFYPDLTGLIFIVIVQFAIAFALGRNLHHFSPRQAGAFFVFYVVLTGFTLSTVLAVVFYPTSSDMLVTACFSTACLFGLMTLIGWRTRLDFCRVRSYVLMALLGLLIAFLANKLTAAVPFDYVLSFFSILLFSALSAYHRQHIASMAALPDLQIKPTDSLRFSMLAALQIYVNACLLWLFVFSSSLRWRSWESRHYHEMPYHLRSQHSGYGIGSSSVGGFGGGVGSSGSGGSAGGGGSIGGGGGGSFTP